MHLPPGRKRRCSTTWQSRRHDKGLTLIEMMVVVAVTLIFMLALTQVFSILGDSVNSGRSMIELNGHIRSMSKRIQHDLDGVTVPLDPPINLSRGEGYFEYVEGPASDKNSNANPTRLLQTDTRLGDWDDVLMFTTRSEGAPFVGQGPGGPIESQVAEIIYWMSAVDLNADGNFQPNEWNLYRRVLLVLPYLDISSAPLTGSAFFTGGVDPDGELGTPDDILGNDISARLEGNVMVANSLADLTKRENRFGRDSQGPAGFPFPFLRNWLLPLTDDRRGDDLLVSGVLAFDVRAFDPTASIISKEDDTGVQQALSPGDPGWKIDDVLPTNTIATGAYVDLNYYTDGLSTFSGPAHVKSGLIVPTYDTWSFHYEHDGKNQEFGVEKPPPDPTQPDDEADEGVDGVDNDGAYGADDLMERETSPPYAVPLRGIQVQVRLYEPSSQAVKQATITGNFVE